MKDAFVYNGDKEIRKSATNIIVSPNVNELPDNAFHGCSLLTSISLPASLSRIGSLGFDGCSSLNSIEIPNSVTAIGEMAFGACARLTSITIPAEVKVIEHATFYECTSLTSIELPSLLREIKSYAFQSCFSLTSITLPPLMTTLENSLFCKCTDLTSVKLPSSLTTIKGGAFDECTALTSITLPPSVHTIQNVAFINCTSLTSIELPPSLRFMHYNTFYGCTSINSITFSSSPDILAIGGAFDRDRPINSMVGSIHDVVRNNICSKENAYMYSSPTSNKLILILEDVGIIENIYNYEDYDVSECEEDYHVNFDLYVDWNVHAFQYERPALFRAAEDNLGLSEGLNDILHANGAAIQEVDPKTGLEAFMLSAVGSESNLETVFTVLQYHPAVIIPYTVVSSQEGLSSRKRKTGT